MQAGQTLVIDGYAEGAGLKPAAIFLYQARRNGAGRSG